MAWGMQGSAIWRRRSPENREGKEQGAWSGRQSAVSSQRSAETEDWKLMADGMGHHRNRASGLYKVLALKKFLKFINFVLPQMLELISIDYEND